MTGLSYEELDSMTLIEAANQFDVVAADNSSIIEAYQVKEQTYFTALTDPKVLTVKYLQSPSNVPLEWPRTKGADGYWQADGLQRN
ncbi:hypothetical protein GQ600_6950 [Phytophthora cactorum]|nr:hypothetical protein GQ600_6950 [Phytophthora cactorum]